jgi:hypothetical protein
VDTPFPLVRVAAADPRERGRIIGEAMLAELEGIAEGAALDREDVLAINARSEIMFGRGLTPPPECTVFFADPTATADGHVLLGQNWDWRPRTAATVTIFEVDQGPERPAYFTVAEAGVAIEAGPGGVEAVRLVHPEDGLIFHTNHFTCTVPFRDVGLEVWADTVARLETIEDFLGARRGSIDVDLAEEALSDEQNHPDSISRFVNPNDHPVLQGATVTSAIMDLTALRAEVTAGPPSANEYVPMTPELAARPTVR